MSKRPQSNKISKTWTSKIVDKNIAEEFSKRLLQNRDLFARLAEIIEGKVNDVQKSRRSKSTYDSPSWSEFQADCNGNERGLMEILELLKFTKE